MPHSFTLNKVIMVELISRHAPEKYRRDFQSEGLTSENEYYKKEVKMSNDVEKESELHMTD